MELVGLEPTTSALPERRYYRLSYSPKKGPKMASLPAPLFRWVGQGHEQRRSTPSSAVVSSGGGIRTLDFEVMSLARYLCVTPHHFIFSATAIPQLV